MGGGAVERGEDEAHVETERNLRGGVVLDPEGEAALNEIRGEVEDGDG